MVPQFLSGFLNVWSRSPDLADGSLDFGSHAGHLGLHLAQINHSFGVGVRLLDSLVGIEQARLVALRHGQSEVLLLLLPNDADRDRAALAAVHGMSKIAAVTDGFAVDFHDHVTGPEPGLLGA